MKITLVKDKKNHIIMGALLVIISVLLCVIIYIRHTEPVCVRLERYIQPGQAGPTAEYIDNTYWEYIEKSYIVVGDRTDGRLYKIVDNIPRNDYNPELFYSDDGSELLYYHDEVGAKKSRLVIDVSVYQQNIDWQRVKAAGVYMAIIRVGFRGYGTGAIVEDEMFRQHLEGAQAAGIKVGVYFFTQAINAAEAVEEAEFVLECIKDENIQGPVVIDVEDVYDEAARTNVLDVEARTEVVDAFCSTVTDAGYEAVIYANRTWFAAYLDMEKLSDYGIWLAYYSNEMRFPYECYGWQYTGQGKIDGIPSDVDLNVWFED